MDQISLQQHWAKCLEIIKDNISPQQFEATFAFVEPKSFEDRILVLSMPSEFIRDFIEKHFMNLMRSTFTRVFGKIDDLYYDITVAKETNASVHEKSSDINIEAVSSTNNRDARKSPDDLTAPQVQDLDSQLRPSYNFGNFIEGDSNRLARSVGEAIAQKPAKTFNPFFVFGPSGVGKTHLVNAIGLRVKELHPQMRVLYISAHLFTVQYTDAVRQNKVNDFIRFYQTIDTLIIDDIQELSGKIQTQNTFFHIFNHLQINGKQIILTCDRPPIAIQGLEERLLTRFKWGLQAEITKPTQTLRKNILKALVNKDGLQIPESILKFISEHVDESVRDLEGIINSLMAHSICYNCEINMNLVQKILPRFVEVNEHPITIDNVKQSVCEYFKIKPSTIDSRCRKQDVAYARQVAMFLSCEFTDCNNTQIGLQIGNRNHATVVHAINTVKDMMEMDAKARQDIDAIRELIRTK
ncbi:MAG: chromosomal replication initiator protein DnaA [Prevotellaceae bacterium]|nr:chromosomal replication initiator protein DnaA [Candidatus Minthosoma caballi]